MDRIYSTEIPLDLTGEQTTGESPRIPGAGGGWSTDFEAINTAHHSSIDSFADSGFDQLPRSIQLDPTHQRSLASSPFGETADFGGSAAVVSSPLMAGAAADNSPHHLQDLFELCAKLVHEYDVLKAGGQRSLCTNSHHPVETFVQNALSFTSLLCDILKDITAQKSSSTIQNNGNAGAALTFPSLTAVENHPLSGTFIPQTSNIVHRTLEYGGLSSDHQLNPTGAANSADPTVSTVPRRQTQDIVLTTTLITTYIYLIRIWRCVFSRLHHLLLTTSPEEISGLLVLPSLQLGGFHVPNNCSIQILVLLELSSGMLQMLQCSLGITSSSDGNNDIGSAREDAGASGRVLDIDPIAVSVRETLLSQEVLRRAREDSFGELSLKEVMDLVRKQLPR